MYGNSTFGHDNTDNDDEDNVADNFSFTEKGQQIVYHRLNEVGNRTANKSAKNRWKTKTILIVIARPIMMILFMICLFSHKRVTNLCNTNPTS